MKKFKITFKEWLAAMPHTFSKIKTIDDMSDYNEKVKRLLHQEYLRFIEQEA